MEIASIRSLVEYGIFFALFVSLFVYVIKMNEKLMAKSDAREQEYQKTIKQLGDTIGITVCDSNRVAKAVSVTVDTICLNLRTINGELDKVKTGVYDVKGTVDEIQLSLAKGKGGG